MFGSNDKALMQKYILATGQTFCYMKIQ